MEAFSALLAIWAGNLPVPGEFPAQRPVTRSFGVFFDLRLNKRLSKQSWGWWFEMLSRPLWRHCNVKSIIHLTWHDGGCLCSVCMKKSLLNTYVLKYDLCCKMILENLETRAGLAEFMLNQFSLLTISLVTIYFIAVFFNILMAVTLLSWSCTV